MQHLDVVQVAVIRGRAGAKMQSHPSSVFLISTCSATSFPQICASATLIASLHHEHQVHCVGFISASTTMRTHRIARRTQERSKLCCRHT